MIDITLPHRLFAYVENMAGYEDFSKPSLARKMIKGLFRQVMELLSAKDESARDNFALAFVSMDYIIWRYELPAKLKPKLRQSEKDELYAEIYNKIEDEDLAQYVKLVVSKFLNLDTLNEAIKMEPYLAIAYYLKGVLLMSKIEYVEEIQTFSEDRRKNIFECIEKMNDLGMLLNQANKMDGLPTIYEDYIGNGDEITFDVIYIILVYQQELLDKDRRNEIYRKEVEKLTRSVNLEEMDSYIASYFTSEVFDELSKRAAIITLWRSGEYFWTVSYEKMKLLAMNNSSALDLTALAVSYLKSIEVYLMEKIFELGVGKEIHWLKPRYKLTSNNDENMIEEIERTSCINKCNEFIKINRGCMLKDQNEALADDLCAEISKWAKKIRNDKLHRHNIETFDDLNKIKEQTIALISSLATQLK